MHDILRLEFKKVYKWLFLGNLMSFEKLLSIESRILDLATCVTEDVEQRKGIERVLSYDTIRPLLLMGDVEQVKAKLLGRRVRLTKNEEDLVILVKNLADYEKTISSWLTTDPKMPYAVEFVLTDQNPKLVESLSFEEIQVLKSYSAHFNRINRIYAASKVPREFECSPVDVAEMLKGKILLLPDEGRQAEMRIVNTEAFQRSEHITRARYCMLAAPGQIDFMLHRGHKLFNIGTEAVNVASCVMVNSAYVDGVYLEGPGKVTRALQPQLLRGKFVTIDVPMMG